MLICTCFYEQSCSGLSRFVVCIAASFTLTGSAGQLAAGNSPPAEAPAGCFAAADHQRPLQSGYPAHHCPGVLFVHYSCMKPSVLPINIRLINERPHSYSVSHVLVLVHCISCIQYNVW